MIGDRQLRTEDAALLTGRGRFLDDVEPPTGTLQAAIVRSPYPHARIVSFDSGAALGSRGVEDVIGPSELRESLRPFPLSTGSTMEYFPAAFDQVRYVGEPVAVVLASDRACAEDGADLLQIEYEPMEAFSDVSFAMAPSAPLLHPEMGTNVASDRTFAFGEVDRAFAEATHIVGETYKFPRYSSTPMECYVIVAQWTDEPDGPHITLHANFPGPFTMLPLIAAAVGLPLSRLRLVVPPDIGGSFGIKAAMYPYMALLAIAAKHARRPVKWVEDRIEHLLASSCGCDRLMRWEAGVDSTGKILALNVDLIDNVGAYLRPPEPATLYRCFGNIVGPYAIDAVRLRARAVVTNKAPTGLNRGFGGQQLYFGLERLIEKIAVTIGVDSTSLRLHNFIPPSSFPYRTCTGGLYDSGDYGAALDRALQLANYAELRRDQIAARKEGRLYGVGIATIIDPSGTNIGYVALATPPELRRKGRDKGGSTEHVRLSVDPFGVVTVMLGTVPQGQGHATVAKQVVADRLGLAYSAVQCHVEMDTALTPWTLTTGSYSSRFSPLLISALCRACEKIKRTISAAAAVILQDDSSNLEFINGMVRVKTAPERAVSFRDAAGLVHWDPARLPEDVEPTLYVEAAFSPPEAGHATSNDQINSSLCYGFVVEVVAVEINPETLETEIKLLVSVHDEGTILNPGIVDGQILGGVVHGLGGALYEELVYDDSCQPRSVTFMDYLCPTAGDCAFPTVIQHLGHPSPFTTLGSKGCGEGSAMAMPVAVANAVADALSPLGVSVRALPLHGSALDSLLSGGSSVLEEWR